MVKLAWFLFEVVVVVLAPRGPSLWQLEIVRQGESERLVRLGLLPELLHEHALKREELSPLVRAEVVEIGVVNNIQPAAEFAVGLIVAFGLLSKLQERLLDLDVWERVDPT